MEEDPVLGGDDLDHELHQLPRRKPSRLEFRELDPEQLPCHRHWRKSWSSRWSLSIINLCYAYLVVPSRPPTCFPFCMQVCGNQDLALLPLLLKGGGEAEHVCRFKIEKKSSIFTNLPKQTIGCNQEDLCQDCILHWQQPIGRNSQLSPEVNTEHAEHEWK